MKETIFKPKKPFLNQVELLADKLAGNISSQSANIFNKSIINFSIKGVNKQRINELLGDDAQLRGDADMPGLMTGYVDLLFKHNEKY